MSVVIRGQERPYGVLGVHTTSRRTFTQDEAYFLQAVANIVAAAIQRQRHVLLLHDHDTRYRELGEGVMGTVAQRREGFLVNDYQQSPYALPTFLAAYPMMTAVLVEPLLVQQRLVGVIALNNLHTGQEFTEQNRELLSLLAAQAAIANNNARLFDERQQHQQRLSNILQINTRIARQEAIAPLTAQIAREAARLVNGDGASVRIRQGEQLVLVHRTIRKGPKYATVCT
jgi:GAF domain-containing protein